MKKYFYILFSFFLTSCIEKIEINNADIEKKIILNCLFTSDSLFLVQLTTNQSILEDDTTYVEDATVEIKLDNQDFETLTYLQKGIYNGNKIIPKTNNVFTINVNSKKYGKISSLNNLPSKIELTNVDYLYKILLL